MNDIVFLVQESPEGGYTAKALEESIFTEADDMPALHAAVRDSVLCHFDKERIPRIIRLQIVREEFLTL